MSRAHWLGLAIPIFVSGCHLGAKEPTGTGSLTAATHSAAGGPSAEHAERMPHCPSVVAGADTLVSEVPGGVELRITAPGDAANEIRTRSTFLATASDETRGEHRGNGGGRAQFGRCPVVMRNTKVVTREIPGGAALVVTPLHPSEVEWLRREVESRSAQLSAPKPFGPGLMTTCPSAVARAATSVTDSANGVDVKVTATTAEGVRSIRERARRLASAGTLPPEERCPVATRDASLVVSDVQGGVSIAIKPKHGVSVESLRHTVRDRARAFAPAVVP